MDAFLVHHQALQDLDQVGRRDVQLHHHLGLHHDLKVHDLDHYERFHFVDNVHTFVLYNIRTEDSGKPNTLKVSHLV